MGALCGAVWCGGQAGAQSGPLSGGNGVAAIVNGKAITKNEVAESARYQLMLMRQSVNDPGTRTDLERQARDKALQDLIDRELIISEFEKMGAQIKPQYVDEDIARLIREDFKGDRNALLLELKRQNLSWQRFKQLHEKKLIVSAMRARATERVSFPTPAQKEQFFKDNEHLFREDGSVWLKTIAIPVFRPDSSLPAEKQKEQQHRLISEIRRRIMDGADFASEARTYSQDAHASNGGDWGEWQRANLAPQIAEMAFSIPVKTISPVFEFRDHYYILLVESRTLGKLKPREEVDQMLDRLVQVEAKMKASEEWLRGLRRKAVIRYPDPAYRPQADLAGEAPSR